MICLTAGLSASQFPSRFGIPRLWFVLRWPPAACGLNIVAANMEWQSSAFPVLWLCLLPGPGVLAAHGPPVYAFARPGRPRGLPCSVLFLCFLVGGFAPFPSRPLSPPGNGEAEGLRPTAVGRELWSFLPRKGLPGRPQGRCVLFALAPLRLRRGNQGGRCLQKLLDFRTNVCYYVLGRPAAAVLTGCQPRAAA